MRTMRWIQILNLVIFALYAPVGYALPRRETFSEMAWREITPTYQSIVNHPFNQELRTGVLPKVKFERYKSQDRLYLIDFAKALAVLASKMDEAKDIDLLLHFAEDCLHEDQEMRDYAIAVKSPATVLYTNFLLDTARQGTREELAAALLPCFWIYINVATDLERDAVHPNPYDRWLTTYSSFSYKRAVDQMIRLVDRLAAGTSDLDLQRMLLAFNTATNLEWLFWDSAYRQTGPESRP